MKMVKSLLLGSAAGLVAVGGVQAADLPVKAKPVEYVKVCSLYGAGYYYVPGTDVCLHLGGYVRQEMVFGYGENATAGPWVSTSMQNTRYNGVRETVWRTRAYMTLETRQQTAYGTLRTYLNVGVNGNNTYDLSVNRGFIQIAGFTVGLASSYFDHYSVAAIAYLVDQSSDTGDGGRGVWAYTAQLGNGVSASLALEEPESKRGGVWNTNIGAGTLIFSSVTGAPIAQYATGPLMGIGGTTQNMQDQKQSWPDVVGNLRIDAAWGSAQVMAAVHDISGGYYGSSLTGAIPNLHPGNAWGWAIGAGLRVNFPMIGPGDYFAAQAAYTEGAVRYISNTNGGSSVAAFSGTGAAAIAGGVGIGGTVTPGNELAYGLWSDGVYCGPNAATAGPTGCAATLVQATTAWGIAGGYEHFWTPSLRTSIHGSYLAVRYNNVANTLLCNSMLAPGGVTGPFLQNTTPAAVAPGQGGNTIRFTAGVCDNNWQTWQFGSRSQWNVTKSFYMGVDVAYYRLETASAGATVNYVQLGGGAQPTGLRLLTDQDRVAVRGRWHVDLP